MTASDDDRLGEIRRFLSLLARDFGDGLLELRLLSKDGPAQSGFFDTDDNGLDAAAANALAADQAGFAVYVGANPRSRSLLARFGNRHNAVGHGQNGKDEDVARRLWLFLDIDPERPTGACATRDEKLAAKAVLRAVVKGLAKDGWPKPGLVCDSGNGTYGLWRIDEPADDDGRTAACLAALAARFNTAGAKIDVTVANASRILRVAGTTNRKGEWTPERPHRRAKATDTDARPVPPPKLVALAALAPKKAKPEKTETKPETKQNSGEGESGTDPTEQARLWVAEQPVAVEGENGSKAAFAVACGLVRDWALSVEEARPLFEEYSERCDPPWSDREIDHKLADAEQAAAEEPERVGWRVRQATARENGAKDEEGETKGKRRQSDYDLLVELAKRQNLWTTPAGDAFGSVEVDGHTEHLAVLEGPFADWLCESFWLAHGRSPKEDALANAAKSAGRLARVEKTKHEAFVRVGWEQEGGKPLAVWIDLCDDSWRAVRITADGWTVEAKPAVRFRRSSLLASLPLAKAGGSFDELRPLVNVADEDWPLFLAFLVGCVLPPPGMFPLLVPHGPAGSGKSTLMRQIEQLVDPRTDSPTTGVPQSEESLLLVAEASWLCRFNNASGLTRAQSDTLCTLVEGGGMSRRTLYDNKGITSVSVRRPAVLNGVAPPPEQTDLLSRTLLLELRAPAASRTDDELRQAFEEVRPRVLGALYDAVARALADYEETDVPDPPRLHALAKWVSAAEPSLGLPQGAVLAALRGARQLAASTACENSPLVPLLRLVVGGKGGQWEAQPADWLA
ncbi:MAG: hypothetical protein H0T47_09565 [Planctomycetaceae bacterium]|nr:hypothetical protein [Planctomycetaceae bacterium]